MKEKLNLRTKHYLKVCLPKSILFHPTALNKKSELMLMRRATAYGSSCS